MNKYLGIIFLLTFFYSYSEETFSLDEQGRKIISTREITIHKSFIRNIGKDFNQDGVYSSDEKALRQAQKSIYVTLPEKRSNWYSTLEKIKEEEKELLPDVRARVISKRGSVSNFRHLRH